MQSLPAWAYLGSAVIGALATLAGVFISWYLRRETRTDELRNITYERRLDLALAIDSRVHGFLLKWMEMRETRSKANLMDRVADDLVEEGKLEPSDIDGDVLHESKGELEATDVHLLNLKRELKKKGFSCTTFIARGAALLPVEMFDEATKVSTAVKELTVAVPDQEEEKKAFNELQKARTQFLVTCREEMGIEKLSSKTKELIDNTQDDFLELPTIPKPYVEAGIRTE